jgi:hypothetical protein
MDLPKYGHVKGPSKKKTKKQVSTSTASLTDLPDGILC